MRLSQKCTRAGRETRGRVDTQTDGWTVKSDQGWPLLKEIGGVICAVCGLFDKRRVMGFYSLCMCECVPAFTLF